MRTTGSRLDGVDLVRLVGVTAIVAGHTWTTPGVAKWLFPWHVPLFFMACGYFWKDRSDPRSGASTKVTKTVAALYRLGDVDPGGLRRGSSSSAWPRGPAGGGGRAVGRK